MMHWRDIDIQVKFLDVCACLTINNVDTNDRVSNVDSRP